MVLATGFEPVTSAFSGQRSHLAELHKRGVDDETRTRNNLTHNQGLLVH